MLWDRHRDALIHAEMVQAFTTAAVINSGFSPPEKGVEPLRWMPNHPGYLRLVSGAAPRVELTPEQEQAHSDYQRKVIQLAAELQQGHGALLDAVQRGERV